MPGLICRRMLGLVLKLCILLIVKLIFEVYQISKLNWITMLKTVPKQRQKDPLSLYMSQQVMIYCLENVLYLRCKIIRAYQFRPLG